MEKTIDEIKDSIINTLRPQIKDDDWIDERDVVEWINDQRNEFAKQQLDKNPLSINSNFLQKEEIELKPMTYMFNKSNLYVAVSKNVVPTILETRGSEPAINTISGDHLLAFPYKYVPYDKIMSYLYGARSFNDSTIFATIDNHYLIIAARGNHVLRGTNNLKIQAVFENPLEISTFIRATDIYPLPGNLRPVLERKIIQEKFGLEIQNYSDESNNADHELKSDVNAG
jgi:hypothetical protein